MPLSGVFQPYRSLDLRVSGAVAPSATDIRLLPVQLYTKVRIGVFGESCKKILRRLTLIELLLCWCGYWGLENHGLHIFCHMCHTQPSGCPQVSYRIARKAQRTGAHGGKMASGDPLKRP